MKTAIFAASLSIFAIAAGAFSQAHAHDFTTDLMCQVTGVTGNHSAWSFANNTGTADGSEGGTFVETGYSGNGKEVYSTPGRRPIWVYGANNLGGLTLLSREAPGWSIVMAGLVRHPDYVGGDASLVHNGHIIGWGQCVRQAAPTAGGVGDVAPE